MHGTGKKKVDPNNSCLQRGTKMLNYILEVIMKLVCLTTSL